MEGAGELQRLLQGGLFWTRTAHDRGVGTGALRRAADRGEIVRLRRGAYVGAERWRATTPTERHRLLVVAAHRDQPDAVFSHASAAALWGLTLIGPWPASVEIAVGAAPGGRSRPGVTRRSCSGHLDVVEVDGVRRSSVSRTVVDLARSVPFVSGLAAADHALRRRLTTVEELRSTVESLGPARGVRAARRVLEHTSGLAESPGESLSRGRMIELRLPSPVLQHRLGDRDGAIGRVDFWWPELRLVGEFDGRLKYQVDGIADERRVEDRLWAEKLREDRLRAGGARVVRWTWDVALDRDRFGAALARHGLHPALQR
ncbi:type IV toxin-antitoxin system AbiEi family antitoxin domain-containing protein [Cellulomonas sp. Leaf334]|uniref:type IV toxin-antitoxin system AbiEi family antitoxin domain-containing protein n=1 Tax=Cellulomonas sp. Leaf334 TaxID=1736339 RepID=UPI0012E1FD20|nr:type IV toxin-antitoxin system AbiEi family antitoxin domain-containing protein [Cellulomonas sp. Leaf334]